MQEKRYVPTGVRTADLRVGVIGATLCLAVSRLNQELRQTIIMITRVPHTPGEKLYSMKSKADLLLRIGVRAHCEALATAAAREGCHAGPPSSHWLSVSCSACVPS